MGTPRFARPFRLGAILAALSLAWIIYRRLTAPSGMDADELIRNAHREMLDQTMRETCADPDSDRCRWLLSQARADNPTETGAPARVDAGANGRSAAGADRLVP